LSSEASPAADQPHGHVVHIDNEGSKTGMWLFLFTELLLFGGLFLIYGVYRSMHEGSFHHAAEELNVAMGVTNTVVLLTSSLTMVLSVNALMRGQKGKSVGFLLATLGLSATFLVIKFFEWSAKYEHHIFPGTDHIHELPHGEGLFFNLYFMMTGLHGVHVVIGMIVMTVVLFKIRSGAVAQGNHAMLEYTGLYWHLVDLIWIFLLPLFYLTT
jgi:cytochrome c oxidase subunit 3